MWVLGPVEEVTADVRVVTGRYSGCDETGSALLRMRDGLVASLTAGWVDVANPVTLQIAGTEGHALIVNDTLHFVSKKVPGSRITEPTAAASLPAAPLAPMHQWLDAVAGKSGQPLVTPREAAARVAVMDAAYESSRTSRWTSVARDGKVE
jgi:predicted dehydrogenase